MPDCARNYAPACQAMFYYVYILESLSHPDDYYTGITTNLRKRLDTHNSGGNAHTRHARPWIIKTAIAFTDKKRACSFELSLKSHSGRAFAKKHF